MNIIQDQSPNYTKGRMGKVVDTIILHSTFGSYWGSVNWLRNSTSKVSSHYIISRDGEIRKLVSESDTAWHSGNRAVNEQSIGIETTDDKSKDITQKAKDALISLVADIKKRHNIKAIKYHREIVPTACPFLNIDKAWFTTVDPLQECLRLHGELVKENQELKNAIAKARKEMDRQLAIAKLDCQQEKKDLVLQIETYLHSITI